MGGLTRKLTVVGVVVGIDLLFVLFGLFHLGGIAWQFHMLLGAIVGGTLTLISASLPIREDEQVERWLGQERIAWIFIGCGLIMWAIGEGIWRYYMLTGQNPFPSQADIGYASLPPLIFIGMLLQPSSGRGRKQLLVLLDSLIAMGSILSIAWYLLLGALTFASIENPLAKFLGLYYPAADAALLSCVVIMMMRGQGRMYQVTARRVGLIVIGVGLCFFTASDFIFNLQQNAGTYVEGTWMDLGWSIGMTTIGLAAYLRRFLPATSEEGLVQRLRQRAEHVMFGPEQFAPYLLLALLFIFLSMNVLSSDPLQIAIRPVLLFSTVGVVGLVVIRQILTLQENEQLTRRQTETLIRVEMANKLVEDQARMMSDYNSQLAAGISHLKNVLASLANGNVRARASVNSGELLPLAAGLNLMAERLMRMEQMERHSEQMMKALHDLSAAFERYQRGEALYIPQSCYACTEINQLLLALGLGKKSDSVRFATSSRTLVSTPQPSDAQQTEARRVSMITRRNGQTRPFRSEFSTSAE